MPGAGRTQPRVAFKGCSLPGPFMDRADPLLARIKEADMSCLKSMARAVLVPLMLCALPMTEAAAGVQPFPDSFHDSQMAVAGGTQFVRVGGRDRPWFFCTASATPATCGNRWRPGSPRTIL